MFLIKVIAVSVVLSSFIASAGLAQEQLNAEEQTIRVRLAGIGLMVERMAKAEELEGYYLVFTEQGVFYVSADAKRLIAGKVFALGGQPIDLTEANVSVVRRELVAEHSASAIQYPAKNEKYKVSIFTDHTCPYCRQLHEQLADYQALGISVEYYAFPRAGLDHTSAFELNSIFCAAKPSEAMNKAMAGTKPKMAACDSPIETHLGLARQMGITGTPGIILPNGQLIPGFVPPERLIVELRKNAAN